ncbi:MAG TPA: DUF4328 domain-containing protein [Candidatus Dormibacteraeota bacterium]|nr:DUF4328 domain-containing protein [Candidatus Dormibacteraeota bacterium]
MYVPPAPPGAGTVHGQAPFVGQLSADGAWRWDGVTWAPWTAHRTFRSAHGRALAAAGLLSVWLVAAVVLVIAEFGRLTLTNRILSGDLPTRAEATDSDNLVRSATYIGLLVLIVAAVFFLLWLHRIVANNHALGAKQLRFTPGWAVGWWFVPVANWARPVQAVNEAWRAADPAVVDSTADTRRLPASGSHGLIAAWWTTWILSSFTIFIGVSAGTGTQNTVSALHDSTIAMLVSQVVRIIGCVLAIVLVALLTGRQDRKAGAAPSTLGAMPPPAVAYPPPLPPAVI